MIAEVSWVSYIGVHTEALLRLTFNQLLLELSAISCQWGLLISSILIFPFVFERICTVLFLWPHKKILSLLPLHSKEGGTRLTTLSTVDINKPYRINKLTSHGLTTAIELFIPGNYERSLHPHSSMGVGILSGCTVRCSCLQKR